MQKLLDSKETAFRNLQFMDEIETVAKREDDILHPWIGGYFFVEIVDADRLFVLR